MENCKEKDLKLYYKEYKRLKGKHKLEIYKKILDSFFELTPKESAKYFYSVDNIHAYT